MTKLSFFKKTAIAAALIAGVSAAGTATAGSMAQATLTLNNLLFKNNAGGATLSAGPGGDFTFITFTDQTNLSAFLNGTTTSYNQTITNGPPLGQHVVCTPSSCAGLPSGTPFTTVAPPPTTNGALSASNLAGSPVNNLLGPGTPATPATAQTGSLAELANSGTANANSVLTLQSTFNFSLATGLTVLLDFNTIVHTLAFMSDIGISNFAQANDNWTLTIQQNGLNIFDWRPDGVLGTGITGGVEIADSCNMQSQVGLFVLPSGTNEYNCSGREAATVALLGNTQYTLSITHSSTAQANFVPEPESVLLMGLGLVGLAAARRRAVRKS